MFIASQKRKENIAEYLLYMWQIEDLIRANDLDIDKITQNIVNRFGLPEDQRKQMIEWYESLIDMMRREDVIKSGHLQLNKNIILQLAQLHDTVLKDPQFTEYNAEYYKTLPFIVELRAKAGENKQGELETCLTALYGMLLLRLQGKEITKDTQTALAQISRFIALLSHYFKLDSEDKLFKNEE
jgi:flagellin-specific chaperone FliS